MPTLSVELVPASTWGVNLRSILAPSAWTNLRKACYAAAGHKCEICGQTGWRGRVEAHERWEYDDLHSVQKLVGVICLCPTCHRAKHIGRTLSVGGLNYIEVYTKIMWVNGWSTGQVDAHIKAAFAQFEERSTREWAVDISWLADHEDMLQPAPRRAR